MPRFPNQDPLRSQATWTQISERLRFPHVAKGNATDSS